MKTWVHKDRSIMYGGKQNYIMTIKIKVTQKKRMWKTKENTERSKTNRFLGTVCGGGTKKGVE
jgi:hypothetical protein